MVKCVEEGYIRRLNEDCLFEKEAVEGELLRVAPLEENWVVRASSNSSKLWAVVKYLPYGRHSGSLLAEGDFFKLGRERYKVKQVSIDGANLPNLPQIGDDMNQPDTPLK